MPYDDASRSTPFQSGVDVAAVFKFGLPDVSTFRQFSLPKIKLTTFGRPVGDRGMRTQQVGFEAYYNSGTTTIATMTTE